jgi:hypothetical protein
VAALVGTSTTVCAQDPQQKGQARVVERRGPEVDLHQNARGQVVVLFPQSAGQQQQTPGAGDVEICFVESQYSQSSDAAGQQTQAQATGREILFSSRDAQNGVVSYNVDPAGNGRKLMLVARVGGESVEVRHSGGSEGVMFFTVQRPQQQAQTGQAASDGNRFGQTADAQAAGGTPAGEGSQGVGSPDGQANGSAPAQGQMDQAQTHQLHQGTPPPEQAAIIIVYTSGGQQQSQ